MTSRAAKKNPTESGYVPCACRDCAEIAIWGPGEEKAYCTTCEAAAWPGTAGGCVGCRKSAALLEPTRDAAA